MTSERTYPFLKDDPTELASDLLEKFRMIANFMQNKGIMARWIKSFNSYYGFYYPDRKTQYGIGSGGTQGELTTVAINQFRNLIQHTLALFTQNKVSFDAIPINSDVEGRNASIVANSLLEYVFEQPKYAQELYRMAEVGVMLGTSFLATTWDTDKNLAGVDGEMNPIFSGELSLKTFTPLDVILEPFKERYEDQEWVCTREIVNRFDLISKYPRLEKEILNLDKIQDTQLADPYFMSDNNHVFLYKCYHKATLAIPFGRYTIFGSKNVIFNDYDKNPYCRLNMKTGLPLMGTGIPVDCFRPAVTYGSAWGHTVGFDLLPLQDIKNMLASTIASNQAVFGVQNIICARGTNMDFADVGNGLRVLEVDFNPDLGPSMGAPSILELLKTPGEIFAYNNKVDEEMEKISGINGALRGTPPPQVSSGTAMALLTTQAQTFNTQVEKAYVDCIQDIANNTLKIIAKFMPEEDIIPMVGLKENFAIKSFKAEELAKIQKVKVLTGNALSKSPAGRLAMAQDMMNSGQISPQEYTEVANTGSLKSKMEDVTAQDALIQFENQQMIQGIDVPALLLDNPLKHILGHTQTLTHPDVRNDPAKQNIIMKHIYAHQKNWVVLGAQNPQLLALLTGSPIPPDQPEPGVIQGSEDQDQQSSNTSHINQPPEQGHNGGMTSSGVGKNNMQNASTPGGNNDMAASAIRSAAKLVNKRR